MKIVINKCFGGFGLSEAAYEKLIEWGIPVRQYQEQERDKETGRYKPQFLNDGEVIFDRKLGTGGSDTHQDLTRAMISLGGRYWDSWTEGNRDHPLLIKVVEELEKEASGKCAELVIVDIPNAVSWEIEEYDGVEHVVETHRTWR